jgi:hypothetical protein
VGGTAGYGPTWIPSGDAALGACRLSDRQSLMVVVIADLAVSLVIQHDRHLTEVPVETIRSSCLSRRSGCAISPAPQAFVDRLVDEVSTFLLSGRAWAVVRVHHEDRSVIVEPAPRGRQPTWGGYLPQFLGFDVCQCILSTLLNDEAFPYLDESASAVLARHREAMQDILDSQQGGIEIDEGEIRWWTFAGGRINSTLRYALQEVGEEWKVIPDNFLIKVRGPDIDGVNSPGRSPGWPSPGSGRTKGYGLRLPELSQITA